MTTRVRFAPSPTGYLHIGSARTALFNYLFARHTKGIFLIRVEDTDLERSTKESLASILDGLQWMGFSSDEEIVFQSANADKHRAVALKLIKQGKAYRDFTPRQDRSDDKKEHSIKKDVEEKARNRKGDKNLRDNPYRNLSMDESDKRAQAGEPFAVRLKVPESGKSTFEDAVYGRQERDYSEIEDIVLLRFDKQPLYNLAVVCDDIEMQITHVIRGQDHLTNTHKQILIYQALGKETPKFVHVPLILDLNRKKLSKRTHGEIVSVDLYRKRGFIAEAFQNFLALVGWSPKDDSKQMLRNDELIRSFSLTGINSSNAVLNFDLSDSKRWTDDKALWMNAEYIRTMPLDELIPHVAQEFKQEGLWQSEYDHDKANWFGETVNVIRERYFTLKDFSEQGRAFFTEDFDYDENAIHKNLKQHSNLQNWLVELADKLEVLQDFSHDNVLSAVKEFAKEKDTTVGVILKGARVLLTGQAVGPSMGFTMEQLGRDKTVKRLKSKIAWNV